MNPSGGEVCTEKGSLTTETINANAAGNTETINSNASSASGSLKMPKLSNNNKTYRQGFSQSVLQRLCRRRRSLTHSPSCHH
jgi:hypothetical protein